MPQTMERRKPERKTALLALLLLVPAPSLGVLVSLFIAPNFLGNLFFTLVKIWLMILPVVWLLRVDQNTIRIAPIKRRDCLLGMGLGILMFGVILLADWLWGQQWIDPVEVRVKAQQVGITGPVIYLAGATYWTFINALIEEYVWRWFVHRKCELLVPGLAAVGLSALCFTLHHIWALAAYTQDGRVVVLGSLGVFTAGAIWSACYRWSRSVWPSYLSHVWADGAIALVGYRLLFGFS